MIDVHPGDRVKMVGRMLNDPDPMEIGAEGTVWEIGDANVFGGGTQIYVDWDNGRSLILLSTDPFVVIGRAS